MEKAAKNFGHPPSAEDTAGIGIHNVAKGRAPIWLHPPLQQCEALPEWPRIVQRQAIVSSAIDWIDATPEVLHNMIATILQLNEEQITTSVLDGVPVPRQDTRRERLIDVNDLTGFHTAQSVLDMDGYVPNLP